MQHELTIESKPIFLLNCVYMFNPITVDSSGNTCVPAKSFQLCLTLGNPMDYNPQGSSVHGILQARILEWVAVPSPRDLPNSGIEPATLRCISCIGSQVLYH